MKTIYKLRSLLLTALFALATITVNAELLLNENFDYAAGELYGNGGWWKFASNPEAPIQLVTPALVYTGYQNSPVGKSVQLVATASGQDLYRVFEPAVGEGSLYVSFLINVTSAEGITDANAAYFFSLIPQTKAGLKDNGSGSEYARLYAYWSSEGKYRLGVSRNNTTLATTTEEYDYSTTYLVVVKYTFVEGATNDIVALYVNPASAAEPAVATALYNQTSGGDASATYGGLTAVELRQGATATKVAPVFTLDALRVATTWAELFEEMGGGDTPEPVQTPAITVNAKTIEFEETFYVGGHSASKTVNVKAENLTADITITTTSENITITPATIAKEDAMAENGVDVTVTFMPNSIESGFPVIVFASEGADDVKVALSAYVVNAVADLSAMMAEAAANGYYYGAIRGEIVVTYAFAQSGQSCYYIQDAAKGLLVYDSYGVMGDLQVGDRFTGASVYYADGDLFFENIGTKGENASVEPLEVTLGELVANPSEYAFRLIRVNDILFAATGEFALGTQYDITQGETASKLSLFPGSDIIGTQLPQKADVVAVVRNATGKLISPRTIADITPKSIPSALDRIEAATLYTESGMLCIDAEAGMMVVVYNLLGTQVAMLHTIDGVNRIALSEGAYLVRVNGKASKVIVK